MMSLDKFIERFNKKYGKILYAASELPTIKWLSSNIFAIDMITGGGLPIGRVSEIWGKKSCGKSSIALKFIASAQNTCAECYDPLVICKCKKQKPIRCFYVDAEGTFLPDYAKKLGVNISELIVARPDYLEQCWDACEIAIREEDIQFIVVDTIASLASKKEIEDSTADKHMAEGARAINQGLRKVLSAINNALNKNRLVTLLLMNQVRENPAIMWGSKDIKPGGLGQEFITSIEIKLAAVDKIYDKEKDIIVGQIIKAVCLKNKCYMPMLEGEFYFDLTNEHLGDTKEVEVLKKYMERYNIKFDKNLDLEGQIEARRMLIDKIQAINVSYK